MRSVFVVLMLLAAVSGNICSACPGGQMWVSASAPIPDGWIKTAKSDDGQQVSIKDITCEPLNSTETIIFESPVPTGWVITSKQIDAITGYPWYTITCIKGAPFLDGRYVIAGFPIPANWVVTSTGVSGQDSFNYIKCMAGAPFEHTETILYWSPSPTGWVSTPAGAYAVITNKNRVTATISNPTNDLMIPSGTSVSFLGSGLDSSVNAILSYSWNFGDGHTAIGTTSSHVYLNTGTAPIVYTVTFKVSDQNNYYGVDTLNITVSPAPVSVTISPTSFSMFPDTSVRFIASVSGTTNTAFYWSVTAGFIDGKGNYTAPSDPGVYYVTVTSLADPSKFATATVTVKPYGKPKPDPIEP